MAWSTHYCLYHPLTPRSLLDHSSSPHLLHFDLLTRSYVAQSQGLSVCVTLSACFFGIHPCISAHVDIINKPIASVGHQLTVWHQPPPVHHHLLEFSSSPVASSIASFLSTQALMLNSSTGQVAGVASSNKESERPPMNPRANQPFFPQTSIQWVSSMDGYPLTFSKHSSIHRTQIHSVQNRQYHRWRWIGDEGLKYIHESRMAGTRRANAVINP